MSRIDVWGGVEDTYSTERSSATRRSDRRIRSLMLGLGASTFISDWAVAVARFADVVGVTMVHTFPKGAKRISTRMAAGDVAGYPVIFIRAPRLRPKRLFWRLNVRVEARLMERGARELIRRHGQIDVIHSHGYAAAGAVPLASRRLGLPLVHTEHSSNLAAEDPRRHVTNAGLALIRRICRAATVVMLVGDVQMRAVEALSLDGRFLVIPNPVDSSFFKGADRVAEAPLRLVNVGYLVPRKRLDLLIRSLRRVRDDIPSIRLDIVGGGSESARLEKLVHTLGLDDNVVFHGSLARPDVATVLESSDLYVHTSERESFGVSIVEALLAGLPVVAVRCGGVTEELPVRVATVIERPEVEVVAAAITAALNRRPFASGLEIASWAGERYGVDSVARRIEAVYREALQE